MLFDTRHTTGWTIASTVLLAVGLSLAPLPESFRPLPKLATEPRTVLASILGERLLGPVPVVRTARAEAPPLTLPGVLEPNTPGAPAAPAIDPLEALLASLGADELAAARELEALVEKLGASPVLIEQGCRKKAEDGSCEIRALDPFFEALDATRKGARTEPVRVVHLGDSLIASDHITDIIRERLQARYGSAGRGLLLVDRPTRGSGRAVRTGNATGGWVIRKITDGDRGAGSALGLTGVSYFARGSSQRSAFDPQGARHAELFFFTHPKGGSLTVHADGKRVGQVLTRHGTAEAAFAKVSLPPKAKTVTVSASGEVQLDGVSFETGGPGLIYDAFGLPGAKADVLLSADEVVFRRQLSQRKPSLVVLMLGGNEAFELGRGRGNLDEYRASFEKLLGRIELASPSASCLLVGPMDAGVRNMRGEVNARTTTRPVAELLRDLALKHGCAFWDMQAAMGGEGSVSRWLEAGLMNGDLVHPLSRGGDALGHLFDLALERVSLERDPSSLLHDPPGLGHAKGDLDGTFAKLDALERTKEGRVAMLQFGASHTAAHYLTDRLRNHLQKEFGNAGRGYVAFGKPSNRLKAASIERSLTGTWAVKDALKAEPGLPWGLTGIRAEGQPGATASIRFCIGCPKRQVPTRFSVHYFAHPQMGRLKLFVDGVERAELPKSERPEGEARIHEFVTRTPGHTITLKNAGGGTVSLFGVASEYEQPGVIYDALGLPGSTIFHLARMDEASLKAQVKARRPDLFVFFYGTNESAIPDLNPRRMKESYDAVFKTLESVAPDAECLFIGPTDRLDPVPDGWRQASSQHEVIRGVREVARKHGCAFWSARAAMGGDGSISRWLTRRPPLSHPDRVHLTGAGYTLLADTFYEDFIGAWAAAKAVGAR